jgi:hypothetical protein
MLSRLKWVVTIVVITISSVSICIAGEGMWLPHLLASLNEAEMKEMGMKMSIEDIYSVNRGSLKDAIVLFNGGCTAGVISQQGLLLTNHHCGYGAIQSHSSVEDNFLRDGFWARTMDVEKPNPGMYVTFIKRIEDVTEAATKGIKKRMDAKEIQSIIDSNLDKIRKSTTLEPFQEVMIRPFFKANQYILFITETYNDIRFVGAPPESIGKFGADTDNWVWPRHTGDFSLFRIYASADNKPAEYSPDNKPFHPDYSMPISLEGVEEGDFTLVFGFPGRTDEYLPAAAVEMTANTINPKTIAIRAAAMKVLQKEMQKGEKQRLKYASKYASLANYWKKWIGESQGINKTGGVTRKLAYEEKFQSKVQGKKKFKKKYGNILSELNALYAEMEPYMIARSIHNEAFLRNITFVRNISILNRLESVYTNNGLEAYNSALPRFKAFLNNQYKNYNSAIDKNIYRELISIYLQEMPAELLGEETKTYLEGTLADLNAKNTETLVFNGKQLLQGMDDPERYFARINKDPWFKTVKSVQDNYSEIIATPLEEKQVKLNALMKTYMKAQMEVFKNKRFYPDANSTLRITYGNVEGYEPRDGVYYKTKTYLSGVMEKYKPGDYEFDVSPKLIELYEKKDYGNYAENGRMPVCFIGTNHTTGGNSGSPVVDAYGNLIGLNFDRAWEGTMSDLNYDASICRNIMVDVRYVLFIIDKYGEADNIIEELKLVRPSQMN